MKRTALFVAMAALLAALGSPTFAQDQPPAPAAFPDESNPVSTDTRVLVGLQDELSTSETKPGTPFVVRTLEPLTTADGFLLPRGTEIRGHVDKVQPAGKMGRARLWLTFDDIRTSKGRVPLVAEVTATPGEHSAKVVLGREGLIQAPSDNRQGELEAAAGAALIAAAPGVTSHKAKEAAMAAAVAAVTAYLAASSIGHEITLQKDMKLELTLARPLYLGRT